MSLTEVTLQFEDYLRTIRNGENRKSSDEKLLKDQNPLTMSGNIPYADESPERPIIQTRAKPPRSKYSKSQTNLPQPPQTPTTTTTTTVTNTANTMTTKMIPPPLPKESIRSSNSLDNLTVDEKPPLTPNTTSSDDTDASTTSKDPTPSIRIDTEVLREMNQILKDLGKFKTKLNRSLSLNYKNHKDDCCCNSAYHRQGGGGRFSLTKDEKTDKNISKKRQLQDRSHHRRTVGNGSIKRRHTVGGTHDYSNAKTGLPVCSRAVGNLNPKSPELVKNS